MRLWSLLLVFAALWGASQAAIFAMDLGTDFMKVSLIKPGRVPISVVVNEMSKRKSRSTVGVVEGDRFLGDTAYALSKRHPQVVFNRLRDYLGKPADHEEVQNLLRREGGPTYPFNVVADEERGTVRFALKGNETISAEELMGSLMYYAKEITAAQAGEAVVDCVITVPAFFGPIQKQAILDAAQLTGLNVMALVHSHAAAALQFGIERDFADKDEDIILYDMGSNSVQVALLSYSSYPTKEKGKKITVSQFEVKDVTWNDNLGGDTLDWVLVDHFASEFEEKYKQSLKDSPRAYAKIKDAVRKTKEMLSANAQAPLFIDGLHNDIDFASTITREQFEVLAGDFFDLAKVPLQKLLERNDVDISKIASIELIGGGTRVPRLEKVLSDLLGGRSLDRHLDADEAIVMGAGLVAANLSTTFRLRQFGLVDTALYSTTMKIDETAGLAESMGEKEAALILSSKPLLPYLKSIPGSRIVNLPNFTADPFSFTLSFDGSDPNGFPPGVDSEQYAYYNISGTQAAIQEHGAGGKVRLSFKADMVGLITLDNAEYWVDVEVKQMKPKNGTNTTDTDSQESTPLPKENNGSSDKKEEPTATDSKEGEADSPPEDQTEAENMESEENGEDSTKQAEEEQEPEQEPEQEEAPKEEKKVKGSKKKKKPKMKLVMVPLKVEGPQFQHKILGTQAMSLSKKVLRGFKSREAEKLEREKAKNDLESYIYSMKEKLDGDEEITKVTTDDQRSNFSSELSAMEDWLYIEGEDEPAKEFRKRLKSLKETGNDFELRAKEASDRPTAVATAQAYVELIRKAINSWPEAKPFLNQTDIDNLSLKTDEFEAWLNEKEKLQAALSPHEKPAFMSTEVLVQLMTIDRPFKRLSKKRPPKPSPPPRAHKEDANKSEEADEGIEEDTEKPSEEGSQNEDITGAEKDAPDQEVKHDEL